MPYPRFAKLDREKRERLLTVAAQEFANHGFEGASINGILERAQMSKGAAYYYFEDKADLFLTVVQYCLEELSLIDQDVEPAQLSAETFWSTFAELHRQPLLRSLDKPWLFAAVNVARRLPPTILSHESLAPFVTQLMTWVMTIVKRGQALGVVRTDIADELLLGWLRALDEVSDQWLLAQWKDLDSVAIARVSDQTVDAMRRALAPVQPEPDLLAPDENAVGEKRRQELALDKVRKSV